MLTYVDVCYVIQVSAISSFLRDKFADVFGEAVMRQKKNHHSLLIMLLLYGARGEYIKNHHSLLIMHLFRYY
jgi:hypothetical protein